MNRKVIHTRKIGHVASWPILTCIIFIAFYIPRIWTFGFYEGDWVDLAVLNSFKASWNFFSSRPVALPLLYLLPRLIDYHPFIWHILLCTMLGTASILLYTLFRDIAVQSEPNEKISDKRYYFPADGSVACWLLFPWNHGWTAWPTLLMAIVSLCFFLTSMKYLISPDSAKKNLIKGLIFYALSLLTYECFYFAFIPFLGMLGFLNWPKNLSSRTFWIKVFSFSGLQAAAIAFNRLIAWFQPGGASKVLNMKAFSDWGGYIAWLPNNLLVAAPETADLIRYGFFALAIFAFISLLILLLTKRRSVSAIFFAMIFGALFGIAVSLLTMGLAGYGLAAIGVMSRTTIAVSLWLSLLIFMCVQLLWRWNKALISLSAVCLVAFLAYSLETPFNHQNKVWAEAWQQTLKILPNAPAEKISNLPAKAMIVYVGPTRVESINFVNRLQLWTSLPIFHPTTALPSGTLGEDKYLVGHRNTNPVNLRPVVVKSDDFELKWNGNDMDLTLPGHWVEHFANVTEVYEWDAYRDTFRKMEPNMEFGKPPA